MHSQVRRKRYKVACRPGDRAAFSEKLSSQGANRPGTGRAGSARLRRTVV